ncbi:MAG: MarR family transcriptional regulator [Aestuariivirga sp.]|nr:MarR family transcriptional regulator [Aestuariivirga sp.]
MTEDFVRASGHLSLGSRLKRIGERLQGDVNRLLEAEGISVPAPFFPALTALQQAGSLTVGGLAEAMGVSQPGVTRSLAQMEKMGLVKSSRGKADQRQRSISLTPKGDQLVTRTHQDLWPRVREAVADLCAGLEGPMLAQLDQMEDELKRLPLDRRAAKPRKE